MSNNLKNSTSPYLLQHAENPVDWYTWCDEAFEKAKSEDKPIFLSIGYSTCHWCHVMAHESFEDESTAEILNKNFISIKVDREERPDIDSVYMSVCQAFTGSGGWPMSIFITADKKPFYAGTYFPPVSKFGMPSFKELLETISEHWNFNRNKLLNSAEIIINHIEKTEVKRAVSNTSDTTKMIQTSVDFFAESYDNINGGFGNAPKFPSPHNLLFLMYYSRLNDNKFAFEMADKTLMQMRKGGIFDHIGYGFSRYSTDEFFLAPHFEKMLYDNALLIIAYSAAYSISNVNVYLDTSEKTAQYILREMTSADGGFYSAQDADSEGVEGKFYTFTFNEIISVLGEEKGREFAEFFDITKNGNFEGANIPNLLKSNDISTNFDDEIKALYDYRKERFKLHLDDKILTSWNSLMITAMSMLYRVSGNETYLNAALNAYKFIEENLCKVDEIYTSCHNKVHSKNGYLDDYAFYTSALIELYNSTFDKTYLDRAEQISIAVIKHFYDDENGGFFLCKKDSSELFINPKETYDGAIPCGNSCMAYNFVRLYQLTDNEYFNAMAKKQIDFLSTQTAIYPSGNSLFLLALMMYENPPTHIVIVPKDEPDYKKTIRRIPYLANVTIAHESTDYPIVNDKTTYYICKNHACLPPVNELE